MPRNIVLLGALMIALAFPSISTARDPAAKAQAGEALTASETPLVVRLKNGLTVLIKKDERFPLANIRLYVHTGSGFESPAQAGVSHLLEHMVFKGTTRRGPGRTAMEIEAAGGSLNAATSFDYTIYYVEVPDPNWALGLDIVVDMAFNAAIAPKELASEKKVVLAELDRGEDTPGSKLFKTVQGMVWKGTSYEWPIIGFRKSVEKLSAADIHAYVDEKYQPQSMLLTVVGKVDPEAVLAEAERLLGGLSNTRPVRPPEPILDLPAGPMVKTVKGKWNKVYLGLAFPVPGLRSGKVAGLETLAQLLGGDETSRLYRTFKYEKRLVDDISAMSMHLERSGLFYIQASLDQDKVEMFWRELMIELSGLDPRDFSSREMERAKLNLEDSLFLAKETLSGLASKLGYFQFFEQGPASEQNYLLALSGVDRDELAGLYAQYIRPDNLSACLLVPDRAGITGDGLRRVLHEVWPARDRAAAGAASPAGHARRTVDLPGGGRLVLIPDQTLPYTALSLFWPGGDGRLDPGSQGLAELASRVLLRGTRTMSANQIEDFLSDRAANVAANAGRDVFSMDAKFPSRFSAEILPLISQMLTDPAWAAKEIDRAKQDQVAAIKRREDQPLGLAFRHIFPFLFRTGPYSYFHDGQPEQVLEFSKQDITGFWSKQSKAPFVLAACGRFDEQVLSEFAAGLAQTLAGPGEAYEFASPRWAGERQTELKLPDRNQAHVLVVFPASGKEDKAASARLSLLRAILAGQSGLLFRDLRDRQGLGYTVTAFLWQAPKTGFMALYIGTEPSKIERSMEGFKKALEKVLEEDLPGQEIDRAKNILLGEYSQEHQTLLSRSREAAALMAWGLDIGLEREIVDLAQTLEAEDLRQEARRVLDWDRAYVMKVTP